mgnify:CR=1 FL=1
MEITKREILFSTIIVCVMVGLGVLIFNPLISSVTEQAMETVSSVQVADSLKLDYIRRTNAGNFLAEGKLFVVDSVSIEDIQGYYSKIEKVKEKYTMHTRVVTTTDSKGHTHSHTETYWSWDKVDSWTWVSDTVDFLGYRFTPKEINYRYHTTYKETIKPKRSFFEPEIRYRYYTSPTTYNGVLIGNADNKSFNKLNFQCDATIEKIVENAESNIKSAPVIFWILWMLLTIGLVVLFYYAENEWLYDKK